MQRKSKFNNLGQAAAFYGLSRAQLVRMRALGVKAKDPMPMDDPAKMPAWFDRQQARGKRRRKCPDSILARAAEVKKATAKASSLPVKPSKTAVKAVAKSSSKAKRPMVIGEEESDEEMLAFERRVLAAYNARFLESITKGEEDSDEGRLAARGREKSMARILDLSKGAKSLREGGDYMRTAQVKQVAHEFANGVFLLLRRELPALFKPAEHARVMECLDLLADRLPSLLPAQFND